MAMGKSGDEQEQLFVTQESLRNTGGHPFYEALNRVLKKNKFDRFVEDLCQRLTRGRWDDRVSLPASTSVACWWATSRESTASAASRGVQPIR